MTTKAETRYERHVVSELERRLPGCFTMKLPTDEYQGMPDRLVLFGPYWAVLEVKVSASAGVRPNQEWYVDKFDGMSFSAFIYPENEEAVLSALQQAFGVGR